MSKRSDSVTSLIVLCLAALACQGSNPHGSDARAANASERTSAPGAGDDTSGVEPGPTEGSPDKGPSARDTSGSSSASSAGAEHSQRLTDPQIAAITFAANKAEVDQGQVARTKATDSRVRDFASMMVNHHDEALREQQRLNIPQAETPDSKQLTTDASSALERLDKQDGKAFDQAYLKLQIEEHQKVLDTIDHRLLPAAKDEQLKAFLEKIRPTVAAHLARAEQLQAELDGSAANSHRETSRN